MTVPGGGSDPLAEAFKCLRGFCPSDTEIVEAELRALRVERDTAVALLARAAAWVKEDIENSGHPNEVALGQALLDDIAPALAAVGGPTAP